MGTTNSSYIGIYLTIPSKKKLVKKTHYLNNRGAKTSSPFCSETGKPNKLVEAMVEELDVPWDEFSEFVNVNKPNSASELLKNLK